MCLYLALVAGLGFAVPSIGNQEADAISAIVQGNWRFVQGHPQHPHQGIDRRSEVAKGQKPIAVVVTCSDSRVSPEIIFDQGLGDLFVVRCAGNVVDPAMLASVEYAIEHLGAKLIIVMGHEKCGAVSATIEAALSHKPGKHEGYIPDLVKMITPSVMRAKKKGGDWLENSIRENVRAVLGEIIKDPILRPLAAKNEITLRGAYYHLDSGSVDWFGGNKTR